MYMQTENTIIYLVIILTTGIAMLVLSNTDKFKNIWTSSINRNIAMYLCIVFLLIIFQWAFGGALYFFLNKIFLN